MSTIPPGQVLYHGGTVSRTDRAAVLRQSGATLWFTGLSGSGKSTLAVAVEHALIQHGHAAYVLDGDNLRLGLNASAKQLADARGYDAETAARFGLGFAAADRAENVRRVGEVARLFADAGLLAVASFVSPYRADRDAVRRIHEQSRGGPLPFVEVWVNTPIETCEQRDPKGLYRQARAAAASGRGTGFTGVDDPYEPPLAPELTFDASRQTVSDGVAAVLAYLAANGLLREFPGEQGASAP